MLGPCEETVAAEQADTLIRTLKMGSVESNVDALPDAVEGSKLRFAIRSSPFAGLSGVPMGS
jgi:hypothetical protein